MNDANSKVMILDRRLLAERDYWLERLSARGDIAALRPDALRPTETNTAELSTERKVIPLLITGELYQQVTKLTGGSAFLLYTLLLATVKLALYHYSGETTLCVGSPSRRQEGSAPTTGNALAILNSLDASLPFRQWLLQVRQSLLDAYAHPHYPMERLVRDLGLEEGDRCPLFDVAVALQELHDALPALGNDITLLFRQQPNQVTGELFYNPSIFCGENIEHFAQSILTLLANALSDSQQPLAQIALLSADQRQQLLVTWNQTSRDYPRHSSIHALFEAVAAQNADAVALIFGEQQMNYGELNQRANQLAHHLRAAGIGVETPVGLCVSRSAEMVVGMLGILKAGGVYVPLDPGYPLERLTFMLSDSQAPVVVTQQAFAHLMPQGSAQLVCLDSDWRQIASHPAENPNLAVSGLAVAGEQLAYLMYTSGSTGTPKGVAVPHRAVNRLVCNTDYIQLRASDRVAQASNSSFDAATFEIWGALLHGATLIGLDQETLLSPPRLAEQLRSSRINVLFLTTALFNQLASLEPTVFQSLDTLLFGGEAVDPRWVRHVLAQGGPRRLLHVYGPTESTTYALWHWVQEVPPAALSIPIGRPIANTQAYVLDANRQPLPVGAVGELYIGGDGVARGYWRRPELSEEKFIANPFGTGKLYKTGDRVRLLADGNIEFLGRIDQQVKLRGFRIELGEIEAVLRQHPALGETLVLVREDQPGEKRLVAYVVAAQGGLLSHEQLSDVRHFLHTKLPEYMVPAAIVPLHALPLTPNGKVDRRALPMPDLSEGRSTSFVPPRSEDEQRLAQLWAELLHVTQVGIHDDFFELGGHSLLATQLISRIADLFGLSLPLTSIFEQPTIAGLAEMIATFRWATPGTNGSQQSTQTILPELVVEGELERGEL